MQVCVIRPRLPLAARQEGHPVTTAFLRISLLSPFALCVYCQISKLLMSILLKTTSTLFKPHQFLNITSTTYRKMSTPAATIKSLDHLVLTVKSIPNSIDWYTNNLGMKSQSFTSVATPDVTRHSLVFGSQKINLHELGKVGDSPLLDKL
jgi:hypothetical protein